MPNFRSQLSLPRGSHWLCLCLRHAVACGPLVAILVAAFMAAPPQANASGPWLEISAGGAHTCAVTASGAVKCWGSGAEGRLGNGATASSASPVDVSGLTSGVAQVDTGGSHACAVTASGAVSCWGYGLYGQLGNGATSHSSTPVNVTGLASGVAQVTSGTDHACVLTTTGGVKCWGRGDNGQLGNGATTNRSIPVDVTGLGSGVAQVSAGGSHTCAVMIAGGVKCWGNGAARQLGDGSNSYSSTPVDVVGLPNGIAQVSAGSQHTCAVSGTGGLTCWGWGVDGQLGNGSKVTSATPVDVTGLATGVAWVSASDQHTCARTTAGAVQCWGNGAYGRLGDGTISSSPVPVDVLGSATGVVQISTGINHTCMITTAGRAKCWGSDASGRLGNGTGSDSSVPVDAATGMSQIAAGEEHTCAVTGAGGVKCWGRGDLGQLGTGATASAATPVEVAGLATGVAQVTVGRAHTCALMNTGGVKCWGSGTGGQLGDGANLSSPTPVDVTGLTSGVVQVSAGYGHTCAVTSTGAVKCWGVGASGRLGNGSTSNSPTPVQVTGLASTGAQVSAGDEHTCAVTTAGGVKCWGNGDYGRLGNGNYFAMYTPTDVTELTSGAASVAAGTYHSCALTTAGAVKCWGSGGRLGDGTSQTWSTPRDVVSLTSGGAAISAGLGSTCAKTTAGDVTCWGDGAFGQLGNGAISPSTIPVATTGLSGGASNVAVGGMHACAITTSSVAKCWGRGSSGQLGDGRAWRTAPVTVVGFATIPGAPTIGAAGTPSGRATSVSFTPPADDGGSPITSYGVTCTSSDGGTTRTSTGSSSPVSVGDLSRGKTYTCTVIATNAEGDSPASAASGSVRVADVPADAPASPPAPSASAPSTTAGSSSRGDAASGAAPRPPAPGLGATAPCASGSVTARALCAARATRATALKLCSKKAGPARVACEKRARAVGRRAISRARCAALTGKKRAACLARIK